MTLKEFARTHKEYLIDANDFEKISTIGVGGFGEVLKARHKTTGVVCALKKLTFDESKFKEEEKYLVREIDILSRTNNKYLLRLLGFSDHYPYCIATDLITNGSLYDALRGHKGAPKLNGTNLTIIAYVTAMAIKSMHDIGLIHRDIKAMNVLLDNELFPHICDFGISRTAAKGSEDEIKTGQIGTPNWMAPEILLSETDYTNKVDIYSYGMMLYEMLTRNVPFKGLQPFAILTLIAKGGRPEIPEGTPHGIKKLIQSCWAQNPHDRPSFSKILKYIKIHKAQFPGTDSAAVDSAIRKVEAEDHKSVPLTRRRRSMTMSFKEPPRPSFGDEGREFATPGNAPAVQYKPLDQIDAGSLSPLGVPDAVPINQLNMPDNDLLGMPETVPVNQLNMSNFPPPIDHLNIPDAMPVKRERPQSFNLMNDMEKEEAIREILSGNSEEKTIDSLNQDLSKDDELCRFFIEKKCFKLIPFDNQSVLNSCINLYDDLFEHKQLVTQSLIQHSIRLSMTFPFVAIDGLYKFLNNGMDLPLAESTMQIIVTYIGYYVNCPNTNLLLDLFVQFFKAKGPDHPLNQQIFQITMTLLSSQVPTTVAATYHSLAEYARVILSYGKSVDFMLISKDYICAHMRYPQVIRGVLEYVVQMSMQIKVNANLMFELVRAAQDPELSVLAYEAIIGISVNNENAVEVINGIQPLYDGKENLPEKMKIIKELIQTNNGKENLGKMPNLPLFFRNVIESNVAELIAEITGIVQSIKMYSEFVRNSANVMFLGCFLRYAAYSSNPAAATLYVMFTAIAMIPVEFSKEFIEIVRIIPNYTLNTNDIPMQRVCISFLYYLVQYPEAIPEMKAPALIEFLKSNLPQEFLPYANAILQKLN